MPLSKAAPRQHMHTRRIDCHGYHREDGLWDIEGSMTDIKSYALDNTDRGGISAGEAIHEMHVRLTIDDQLVVHAAEAITVAAPFTVCPAVAPSYACLQGLRIGPGWRRDVLKRLGRAKGCTHHTDLLLGPMAVTAFQAVRPRNTQENTGENTGGNTGGNTGEKIEKGRPSRPPLLNSCHALASDGAVAKRQWPDFYTGA